MCSLSLWVSISFKFTKNSNFTFVNHPQPQHFQCSQWHKDSLKLNSMFGLTYERARFRRSDTIQVEGFWESGGGKRLQGKGCLMEAVCSWLIICWPVAGNKHAEMFRAKVRVKEQGLMAHISVMHSVWLHSGPNTRCQRLRGLVSIQDVHYRASRRAPHRSMLCQYSNRGE